MLQSNSDTNFSQPAPFTPIVFSEANGSATEFEAATAPCSVSEKLIEVFEQVTGWKVEFAESKASLQRRASEGDRNGTAEGKFSIVDMSVDWPAKKPTGHRAKCDELVALIDSLCSDLQSTKIELQQTRSALAGIAPDAIDLGQEAVLTDSFVPKFIQGRRWDDTSFELASEADVAQAVDFDETAFVDEEPSGTQIVAPPFRGWSLGGEAGVVEKAYVDWLVSNDEKIVVTTGMIESSFGTGDRQAIVEVDPLTKEYLVAGSEELDTLYLWDSKTLSVSPLNVSGRWCRLKSGQAIIGTTSMKFGRLTQIDGIDGRENVATKPSKTGTGESDNMNRSIGESSHEDCQAKPPQLFTANRVWELLSQKLEEFDVGTGSEFEIATDKMLVLMCDEK
ncbi:MAG: hypothetical protein AB8B55_20020 [Mariniblastus sp.]